jgi:murein DD-endopeptidase / murein LD-carboxypeptidase
MTGEHIAERARREIGTAFRLHGRSPGVALDCVGLVATAIGVSDAPAGYSLKGNHHFQIESYFRGSGFALVDGNAENGDIAVVHIAAQHQHLMIRAGSGWVHAHAGLGRIVHTPDQAPWPIIALWRVCGD